MAHIKKARTHTHAHTHPYTHLREMHEGSGTHITYITHHSGDRRGPCPVPLQVACACSHWPGRPLPSNLAQAARSPAPLPLRGFFFSTMPAGCSCMARPGGGEGCGVGAQQARRLGMITASPEAPPFHCFSLQVQVGMCSPWVDELTLRLTSLSGASLTPTVATTTASAAVASA